MITSLLVALSSNNVFALDSQVNAFINNETKMVNIEGKGAIPNKAITVKVERSDGSLDFIDQTTSRSNGDFSFEYITDGPYGEYTVKIGGNGFNSIRTTVFHYSEPTIPETPPSGGGNSQTPTTPPTPPVTVVENNDGSVSIIKEGKLNQATKVVELALDKDVLNNALEKANFSEKGSKTIVIEVPAVKGAKGYAKKLPAAAMNSEGLFRLSLVTEVGTFELENSTLANQNLKDTDEVVLNVSTVSVDNEGKKTVEAYFTVNNSKIKWKNTKAPIKISIPYTPSAGENPEHLVIKYIDEEGNATTISNGRYNVVEGTMDFTTSHFSKFAIAYVHETFSDLINHVWAQREIEVLASKGIIRGTSTVNNTFTPAANITRADFTRLLVNTLGLTADIADNFDDIDVNDYFYYEVGIAKALGISNGVGDNKFNPKAEITREEMMTLTGRAMTIAGIEVKSGNVSILNSFIDGDNVATYAQEPISTLVANGLIQGNANNTINPKGNATRAETATFMYRLYNFQ